MMTLAVWRDFIFPSTVKCRPDLFLIFGHYIAILSQRSDTMRS